MSADPLPSLQADFGRPTSIFGTASQACACVRDTPGSDPADFLDGVGEFTGRLLGLPPLQPRATDVFA
jgi:hypothetical protein